jgi:hypothetical protein
LYNTADAAILFETQGAARVAPFKLGRGEPSVAAGRDDQCDASVPAGSPSIALSEIIENHKIAKFVSYSAAR